MSLNDDIIKILYEYIKETSFKDVSTGLNNPSCFVVCGQPGAGKSSLVFSVFDYLNRNNLNAVFLDVDYYRIILSDIVKENNLSVSFEEIKNIACKIMEWMTLESINKMCNIVVETTLENNYTLDMAKKNNYKIYIKLLVVSRTESLLSNFERYANLLVTGGYCRLTTIENHDRKYKKIIGIVKNLYMCGDNIEVYQRGRLEMCPRKIKLINRVNLTWCIRLYRVKSYFLSFIHLKKRLYKINFIINHYNVSQNVLEQLRNLNYIFHYKYDVKK